MNSYSGHPRPLQSPMFISTEFQTSFLSTFSTSPQCSDSKHTFPVIVFWLHRRQAPPTGERLAYTGHWTLDWTIRRRPHPPPHPAPEQAGYSDSKPSLSASAAPAPVSYRLYTACFEQVLLFKYMNWKSSRHLSLQNR